MLAFFDQVELVSKLTEHTNQSRRNQCNVNSHQIPIFHTPDCTRENSASMTFAHCLGKKTQHSNMMSCVCDTLRQILLPLNYPIVSTTARPAADARTWRERKSGKNSFSILTRRRLIHFM